MGCRGKHVGSTADDDCLRRDGRQRVVYVVALDAGQKPAAVVNEVVRTAAAATAPTALTVAGVLLSAAPSGCVTFSTALSVAPSRHAMNEFEQRPGSGSRQQAADSALGDAACRGSDQNEAVRFRRTLRDGTTQVRQRRHAAHRMTRQRKRTRDVQGGENLGEVGGELVDPVGGHWSAGRTTVAAVVVGDDANPVAPPRPQLAHLEVPALLCEEEGRAAERRWGRRLGQNRSHALPGARRHLWSPSARRSHARLSAWKPWDETRWAPEPNWAQPTWWTPSSVSVSGRFPKP